LVIPKCAYIICSIGRPKEEKEKRNVNVEANGTIASPA